MTAIIIMVMMMMMMKKPSEISPLRVGSAPPVSSVDDD